MNPYATRSWERAARRARGRIAELLQVDEPLHIVLTPGILIGLRLVIARLRATKLVLTTQEFYQPAAFPDQQSRLVQASEVADVVQGRSDMVIASLVDWRGNELGIDRAFRAAKTRKKPILVADYSHAGALGFPPAAKTGADIICGDVCKWVLKPGLPVNFAFLWFRSAALFNRIYPTFCPFFLAVEESVAGLRSRWLDPSHVARVANVLSRKDLSRSGLARQHRANMRLARDVASSLNLRPPRTSILWLSQKTRNRVLTPFRKKGLVWDRPDGIRIMCRADVLDKAQTHHR